MLNGLLRLADIRQSRSRLRSHSVRLLSGLGLATAFPLAADAARKDDRRGDKEDRRDDGAGDNRNDGGDAGNSGKDKNADAKSDEKNSDEKESKGDEARNSNKNERGSRGDEDDAGGRNTTEAESDRQATRRQEATAESDESPRKNNDGGETDRGGRRSQEFEQSADDQTVEDEPEASVVAPTNPNIVITDIPQITDVDLVVEANPDVIASVSTSGGFAFARSGDVTAITGPDGASIIRSGDGAPATTTDPVEPSDDGGNNDLDFSS